MNEFYARDPGSSGFTKDFNTNFLPPVIRRWDLQSNLVWWGKGWQQVFGHEGTDYQPVSSWEDNIHPDDQDRVKAFFEQTFTLQQQEANISYRFKKSDGSFLQVADTILIDYHASVPVSLTGFINVVAKTQSIPVVDEYGQAVPVAGIAMDFTRDIELEPSLRAAETAAEKSLRESEALFRKITDASTAALWITDANGDITYFSKAWLDWTGAPLEAHLGNGWLHFVAREDLEAVITGFQEDFEKRAYHHKQFCIVHTDSTVRCVVCTGSPQYDHNHKFAGYIGASVDVTELVQAQKQLAASEAMLQAMIEQAPVAITLLETEAMIIKKINPAALVLIGKDDAILGTSLLDVLPELDDQGLIPKLKDVYQSGNSFESYDTQVVINDKQGPQTQYFNIICTPIRSDSEEIKGVMVMAADITWQHQAKSEVRASEQKFQSLIESSPVACALFTGSEMIIEYANEAMVKVMGKGQAIQGAKLMDALPELKGQPYLDLLETVYRTGLPYRASSSPADLVVDGKLSTYYFDISYTPLFDKNQNVYAILEMTADVTERVNALASLQESEQRYRELANDLEKNVQARTLELDVLNKELQKSNESLEEFAYAASHDLQEPLRKVQAFGTRLQAKCYDQLNDEGRFLLNRMQDASRRMAKMIDDLLAFSRLKATHTSFGHVDLEEVVRAVVSDMEISIQEKNAVININLPVFIWGDASQLTQLFLNLLSNALKYQPSGQAPYVDIAATLIDPSEISSLATILPDHPYVKITVQDNGIGFDQKHVQRIFHMFQRLHGANQYSGSGIGLALCNKVVQNHYGLLTAESEPDKGSCFIVYLPAAI